MEDKRKRIRANGSDTDRAFAKVGSSKPEKLKTDEPLAEKDEVKQAEENLRRRLKKSGAGFQGLPLERKTTYLNKPHTLFK